MHCCGATAHRDGYNICGYMTTMTKRFKLKAIGNSVGLILPKEELARLGVQLGDTLSGVQTPNGIELRPYDPAFDQQMEAARKIMHKRKAVLRELAK